MEHIYEGMALVQLDITLSREYLIPCAGTGAKDTYVDVNVFIVVCEYCSTAESCMYPGRLQQ